jgi:GNAT superfamily N-acetyltransferase
VGEELPSRRYFTRDYVEHATLLDGRPVELRLVAPSDRKLLEDGFHRLSEESRYARFLGPKTSLTEEELRYLTEIDQETHVAIGAAGIDEHGDEVGLGIARFIRLPGPGATAEAAVAVTDEVHGLGLGRLLFMRLCAAALERGVRHFRCELLASNRQMRALIEAVAPSRSIETTGGVMTIDMQVPEIPPDAPVVGPAPEGSMYRLFRAAAGNAVEWTDAVRRLWRRE